MNLKHHPQVAAFLHQLSCSSSDTDTLRCPVCGQPISVTSRHGRTCAAICSHCDFHAQVPRSRISS